MKPTILVTGATGSIGRELIPKLLPKFKVVGCARSDFEKKLWEKREDFIFEKVDLTKREQVERLFKEYNFDQVIHLAAYIKGGEVDKGEAIQIFNNNVMSTLNILSVMDDGMIIFASSMTVYGIPNKIPVYESTPLNPTDFYAKSKVICENLIEGFSKIKRIKFLVLRIPGIFSKERKSGALFNFASNAWTNRDINISLDKPTPWDIIYIEDLVNVIARAVSKKNIGNMVINVGYGEKVELELVAKKIKVVLKSSSKIAKNYSFKNPVFCFSTQKMRSLLNVNLPSLDERLNQYLNFVKEGQ